MFMDTIQFLKVELDVQATTTANINDADHT